MMTSSRQKLANETAAIRDTIRGRRKSPRSLKALKAARTNLDGAYVLQKNRQSPEQLRSLRRTAANPRTSLKRKLEPRLTARFIGSTRCEPGRLALLSERAIALRGRRGQMEFSGRLALFLNGIEW